tara:strand:- start:14324 stop:15370 length:1047 start_codon:yes stop_codon:yes gene_type:complete
MKYFPIFLLFFTCSVIADSDTKSRAIDHAPIGVSADHYHKKNESMISIRHGYMKMSENIFNGSNISSNDILMMPNPLGNMPANLSVVPTDMSMQMSMIGGMYAPSDKITLMIMGMFVSKSMNLNSYQAMMNRDLLGDFNSSSKGISDVSIGALIRLREDESSRLHADISLQKSIGNNKEKGIVLTPMNSSVEMTLPYGMQLGDKSLRIGLGLTHLKKINQKFRWGNQVRTKFILSKDNWNYGNQTELNSWFQYEMNQMFSVSTRLKWIQQNKISGSDSNISAPVQTANPKNYGGKELLIGFGANYLTHLLPGKKDRLGFEVLIPINQQKNNLQMKSSYQIIVGYQKSF